LATAYVVIGKLALVAPARTVTLAGTDAAAGSSLDSGIWTPPAGAAAVSVTVPLDESPPITSLGLTITLASAGVDVLVGEVDVDELLAAVQPASVALVAVGEPSLTWTTQSAGGVYGSFSILKLPLASLVPIATPLIVITALGFAVPSTRSCVAFISAFVIRAVACAAAGNSNADADAIAAISATLRE
jgi:hypothetical protein